MPSFNGSVPNPYWFDPLALHESVSGSNDASYRWWLNALSGSLGQFLMNMDDFCSADAPVYVAMTPTNIEAIGLKTMYLNWMSEYLYSITSTL
jgi:hypothetical protein